MKLTKMATKDTVPTYGVLNERCLPSGEVESSNPTRLLSGQVSNSIIRIMQGTPHLRPGYSELRVQVRLRRRDDYGWSSWIGLD